MTYENKNRFNTERGENNIKKKKPQQLMPVFDSINSSDIFIYFCITNKRNRQFQYNTPAIISNRLLKFYMSFRDIFFLC